MAPIGMVGMMDWFSSPEVGIISLVVFLVLSITLVGLCARCHRSSGNAYDVNASTTDGAIATKTGDAGDSGTPGWRSHNNMPASTLDRPHAATN